MALHPYQPSTHLCQSYLLTQTHNSDWQEVVWDAAAVLQLAQQHFPWMLPVYLAYPKLVQRSDIARYMILYTHGGVYLDADVSGGSQQPVRYSITAIWSQCNCRRCVHNQGYNSSHPAVACNRMQSCVKELGFGVCCKGRTAAQPCRSLGHVGGTAPLEKITSQHLGCTYMFLWHMADPGHQSATTCSCRLSVTHRWLPALLARTWCSTASTQRHR